MSVSVEPSAQVAGVLVLRFQSFSDDRGYFLETYRRSWLPPGAPDMVQGNYSFSRAGVLRGMHYHRRQADLWSVPMGSVRAALFDFRSSSPTFRHSMVVEMGGANRIGLYIPRGVAHGFRANTDTIMTYLVDQYYDGSDELGILWNDPAMAIPWGEGEPIVSDRDRRSPLVADIPAGLRPL